MSLLPKTFYAFSVVALLALTSCGFQPVYNSRHVEAPETRDLLSRTVINLIPDQEGVYLRNQLIDRFYLDGRPIKPLYTLSVTRLDESLTDLDITKSSYATRGQLRINADIILKDASDKTVLSRSLTAITSYNILASEFTNRVSEDNARRNALDDLARQIENQVTLYFNRAG